SSVYGSKTNFSPSLNYPDMVETLLLAAPTISGYKMTSAEMRQRWQALVSAVKANDRTRLFDLWANDPMMPRTQEYPAAHQRDRELLSEYSFVHDFSPGLQPPLVPAAVERLRDVELPTLILVGDRDSEEVLIQADLLAEGI